MKVTDLVGGDGAGAGVGAVSLNMTGDCSGVGGGDSVFLQFGGDRSDCRYERLVRGCLIRHGGAAGGEPANQ